jgi:hypothetical protein
MQNARNLVAVVDHKETLGVAIEDHQDVNHAVDGWFRKCVASSVYSAIHVGHAEEEEETVLEIEL